MKDWLSPEPDVFKTKEGQEKWHTLHSGTPQDWEIGWRDTGTVREMVRWDRHFGCWLNKAEFDEIRLQYKHRGSWEEIVCKNSAVSDSDI